MPAVDPHPYLSAAWHDAVVALAADLLPRREGASGVLAYKVTGTPTGDVTYSVTITDGRLVAQGLGKNDTAAITFTVSWADAVALMRGDLDANVAVMQGRIKADGDIGRLMAVLPVTGSNEYRVLQERVRALTEV
jgi:alkyl sulfatase BDS1-like metallo-beta-lactamase superfamily hydrolase